MYLEKINSPSDIKKLSVDEMKKLTQEMRDALIFKLSRHGGHCGPNLGFAEATVALHYVFDSPVDKIVFDVSHQTYCHKMLTGRKKTVSFMKSILTIFRATLIPPKANTTFSSSVTPQLL